MHKFALAAPVSEDGHLEAAASFWVSNELVAELARNYFLDLLDRCNCILAVASAAAVLDVHHVGSVCVLNDCL